MLNDNERSDEEAETAPDYVIEGDTRDDNSDTISVRSYDTLSADSDTMTAGSDTVTCCSENYNDYNEND
jgi:hypothetical protein